MNKDAIILSLMVAVVIAAGAVFFLFSQDDESEGFTPADQTNMVTDGEAPKAVIPPRRVSDDVQEMFGRKDPLQGMGPEVVADEDLAEEYAARIGGRVVNSEGEGIANAAVALCVDMGNARNLSVLGEIRVAALTDKDGFYSIDGIAVDDRYAMRVEAEGHASKIKECITLQPSELYKVNFQLSEGQRLTGLVADTTGTPIPGATIIISDQATRSADPSMDVEKTATTDENGEFVCLGINPGMKRVSCLASGFGTQTQIGIQVIAGKPAKPVEFKLLAGGVDFIGRVIDSDDELAIAGVIVRAQPISTGRVNIPSLNYPPVKTDDDGVFTLSGLQPGSYRMRFFGGKGYPLSGTMRTARVPGSTEMVVKLDREPTAIGQVVDAETGLPVKRFKIFFARSDKLVMASPQLSQKFEDEEGKFEYVGVQTKPRTLKDFYLHARAKGYAGGSSKKLSLNGVNDITDIVIEMYRGAVVTGKVVDSAGKPVNNAEIDISPQMGPPNDNTAGAGLFKALISNGTRTTRRTARTNPDGEFRIENVAEGWYLLNVNHTRFADGTSENSIEVGKTGEYSFPELTLMKGGTVKGRVLTKEGEPEKGAKVRLQAKGGLSGGRGYQAQTDSGGRFVIRNVRPRVYMISVIERNGAVDLSSMFQQALTPGQEIILGDGEVMDLGDI